MLRTLLHRRVPQILGIYLAAGWGVLEFVDWLAGRYSLSPHLIDFSLATWALMIPTVLMLAYYHGAPGRDEWTRVEKIGVPVNFLAAGALLFVLFSGKELGAITRSVTLQTEAGEQVEREVPKQAFVESLAIFHFANRTGDPQLDWLQFALPYALQFDLSQDYFIDYRFGFDFNERLKEKGYPEGTDLPLTLQREIADELHMEHFVTGAVIAVEGEPGVEIALYDTRRAKRLSQHRFVGSNPLELADRISLQIKQDLDVPEGHLEQAQDLPAAEMLTDSEDAFRAFIAGYRAAAVEADWQAAVREWQSAAELDPEFAMAYWHLALGYTLTNDARRGREATEKVMSRLYRLPERMQFAVKTQYYWLVKQDVQRARATAAMYTELFPQDPEAHKQLGNIYEGSDEPERAIAAYRRALRVDPRQFDLLLSIGNLYRARGAVDSALAYYDRYSEEAPADPRGQFLAAGLHHLRGDHAEARRRYERALVLEPAHIPSLIGLAQLEADLGNFSSAEDLYEEASRAARTGSQRAEVFNALSTYYARRGQTGRAVDYMHQRWAEIEESDAPFNALQLKIQDLDIYVLAGRESTALDSLEAITGRLSPPFDILRAFGAASIYLALEEPDSLEAALAGVDSLIQLFGLGALRPYVLMAEGRVFEWRDACDQAIVTFERAQEMQPESIGFEYDLGRCYRKLGQLERARDHLTRFLEARPYHGEANYELALVYEQLGRRDDALGQIQIALDVWSDATPVFEPAREARAKFRELGGTI